MIVSLAATRDGKHRPRSIAFYDIVAALVHASIDEVVGVVPRDGLLEKGECFLLLKVLYGTRMASMRCWIGWFEFWQTSSKPRCWDVWVAVTPLRSSS